MSRSCGSPVGVRDRDAVGGDRDDLAVLDLHHGPGLAEEGRDRGGEEGLPLADADHQRTLLAGADEQLGVVDVHRDEGVVAAEIGEGAANRGGQIAVVVALDQVGDDLGVGLGAELVPVGEQLATQLGVVLDDAVEDDVDLARARRCAGWAFSSVTRPCVAQRVWARPIVASASATATAPSSRGSATAARRLARLPTARTESIRP